MSDRQNDCEQVKSDLQAALARIGELERANAELLERSRLYQDVVDAIPDPVLRFTKDFKVQIANRAFARFLDTTVEDLIGTNLLARRAPDDYEPLFAQLAKITPQDPVHRNISLHVHADGKHFWVEWTDAGLFDENGQMIGCQSVGRDITALHELHLDLQRKTAVLDQAQDIIVLAGMDGRLIYMNDAGARILGYESPSELIGQNVEHFQADQDAVDYMRNVILPAMLRGQWRGETRLKRRDGTVLEVEQSAFTIRNDGEVVYLATIMRDLRVQKQVQANLERSEERFERVFTMMPFASAIIKVEDRTIREVNEGFIALSGFSREEVIGKTPQQLGMLEKPLMLDDVRDHMVRTGVISNAEITFRNKSGQICHGLLSAAMLELEQEPHLLVAVQDLTAYKQLQAREQAMLGYLREVVQAADELLVIQDDNTFERRAVELLRERLNVERSALFLSDEKYEVICGTYGTDPVGDTVDEHAVMIPYEMFDVYLDAKAIPYRLMEDTDLNYWGGDVVRQFGRGWLAMTPLRMGNQLVGVLTNDNGLTGDAFDPVRQEAVSIYATVLGNIIERRRTEKDLRASDQRYRMLVENSNAIIAQIGIDGRLLYVNQSGADYFGRVVAELIGKHLSEIYSAEQAATVIRGIQQILDSGETVQYETVGLVAESGKKRLYSSTIYPLHSDDGKVSSVLLSSLDITPIREAQAAQREAEARYRMIVETAQEGILMGDRDGVVTYVNHHCQEMFGYSADSLIGRKIFDLVLNDKQSLLHEQLERRRAGLSDHYDVDILHADGSMRWVSVNATPVRDEQGEMTGFLSMYTDISDRKRAETELQAAKDELERRVEERTAELEKERTLLRTLIDSMPDLVYAKDRDHRFILCNQAMARVFNVESPQDLVGKTDADTIPLEKAIEIEIEERELIQNGKSLLDVEIYFPTASDTYTWTLTNKVPLRTQNGEIFGLMGVTRDITAQKQAEAELKQKYEDEQQFRNYLRMLHEIMIDMTAIDDPDALYRHIVEAALNKLGYERFGLFLYDNQRDYACCTYGVDADGELVQAYSVEFPLASNRLMQLAMQDPSHFYVDADADILDGWNVVVGHGTTAILALSHGDEILGWITTDNLLHHQPISGLRLEVLAQYGVLIASVLARKRTEQALRRSEETYRTVVNALGEGIVLQQADGQFEAVNGAAERILGLRMDQINQQAVIDPGWQLVWEDGTSVCGEKLDFVSSGHSFMGSDVVMAIHKPDDSLTWISVNAHPILSEDASHVRAVVVTIADITSRKIAEDALRDSEEKYRLLMDKMGGAVMMFDPDWNLLYANNRVYELTGYSHEELEGKGYARLGDEETKQNMLAMRDQRKIGQSSSYEMKWICKDQRQLTMLVNGTPIFDSNGQYIGSFSVSVDISAQKDAEEALRRALEREQELGQLKTQFVSTTSHEFRTPLTIINAVAETLLKFRDRLEPRQVDERLEKIRGQVSHLRQIMDDVLQLAKIQSGRMEFKPTVSDLGELCQNLTNELNSSMEAHERIRYQAPENAIEMAFDQRLMRQILINLLSNGLKYSDPDQPVDLTLTREGDQVMIRVQDHGIGIPAENLPNMFEPFHRANNVGTIPGTGLGMPIVKESVELHGGEIMLDTQEGSGTTFTVLIPIVRYDH